MFRQVARIEHSVLRPVPLGPNWPERPSLRFFLCLGLIVFGLLSGILGLAGAFAPGRSLDIISPLVIGIGSAPAGPLEFKGQSADEMRARFGTPALIRREPPAEIWQYRNDTCVLDLYLYGEIKPDTVHHAEVRTVDSTASTAPDFAGRCLFALQSAARL
jgi:hypothetical protein